MDINSFNIMRYLSEQSGKVSQRSVSENVGLSLGTVNTCISKLASNGYIDRDYRITEAGYEQLKPYEVDNAIILAAGMSTRFVPISYERPKGLLYVKGEILIERLIRQLQEAGVKEIVVVVGYMMEKFFYLRDKYSVKLVINNEYETKNTHSSVYVARKYLGNTYICCADNYYPENMFHRYEYRAFYCSIFLPGINYAERAFTFDKKDLIIDTNRPSHDQWIMYGHAYYDRQFTERFRPILESYYGKPGVENMYWETIYAERVKELPMYIKRCSDTEILEFDSMDELKAFDPGYISHNKIELFENICKVLGCQLDDISDIEPIKGGLNNKSFKFCVNGSYYVYRHPGENASGVIDRKKELTSLTAAKKLGIDDTLIHMDGKAGWKISKYINVTEEFDFGSVKHMKLLATHLKTLHDSKISVGFGFNYKKEADKLIDQVKKVDRASYQMLCDARNSMKTAFEILDGDPWQVSLCHNDLYVPNLLISGDTLSIIDWEFAGDADIGYDICKLFSVLNPSFDEIDKWLKLYYGRKTTKKEKLHLISCAAVIYYYWFVWAVYVKGDDVSEYLITWYDKMVHFCKLISDNI